MLDANFENHQTIELIRSHAKEILNAVMCSDQCCLRQKFVVFKKMYLERPPQQSKKRMHHQAFQDPDDDQEPQDKDNKIIQMIKNLGSNQQEKIKKIS